MKEDVLEQIVEDYLQFEGYFTAHNVRFRPRRDHPEFVSNKDSVPSDIDVLGFHPRKSGLDRVVVVTCKSWQSGFDATKKLADLRQDKPPTKPMWHHFRELWIPKWSEGLRDSVHQLTGETTFSYKLAVTHLNGDSDAWASDPRINQNLAGSSFEFLTLETMWKKMLEELKTTPAPSEIGRLAQVLKAAKLVETT